MWILHYYHNMPGIYHQLEWCHHFLNRKETLHWSHSDFFLCLKKDPNQFIVCRNSACQVQARSSLEASSVCSCKVSCVFSKLLRFLLRISPSFVLTVYFLSPGVGILDSHCVMPSQWYKFLLTYHSLPFVSFVEVFVFVSLSSALVQKCKELLCLV